MPRSAILLPCLALVGLIAVVWVRMFVERVGEMRERRIASQALATSRQMADRLQRTQAADNFHNLFEIPVLFFALCLALYVTQTVTAAMVAGAWSFVALRVLHSLIQCTYNRVDHRFTVYVLGTALLFVMWGAFGVRLIAE